MEFRGTIYRDNFTETGYREQARHRGRQNKPENEKKPEYQNRFPALVWGQEEQFSEKLRKVRLNS